MEVGRVDSELDVVVEDGLGLAGSVPELGSPRRLLRILDHERGES